MKLSDLVETNADVMHTCIIEAKASCLVCEYGNLRIFQPSGVFDGSSRL